MSRLTQNQLREIRVFNPGDFVGMRGFYLGYVQHSRQTMGSFGWSVWVPGRPSKETHTSGHRVRTWSKGSAKPEEFRPDAEPILAGLGFEWPAEWVRFMSVWIPKDRFEYRMAELVQIYKAKEETHAG